VGSQRQTQDTDTASRTQHTHTHAGDHHHTFMPASCVCAMLYLSFVRVVCVVSSPVLTQPPPPTTHTDTHTSHQMTQRRDSTHTRNMRYSRQDRGYVCSVPRACRSVLGRRISVIPLIHKYHPASCSFLSSTLPSSPHLCVVVYVCMVLCCVFVCGCAFGSSPSPRLGSPTHTHTTAHNTQTQSRKGRHTYTTQLLGFLFIASCASSVCG